MTKELLQEQLEILDRTNMHKNAAKERVIPESYLAYKNQVEQKETMLESPSTGVPVRCVITILRKMPRCLLICTGADLSIRRMEMTTCSAPGWQPKSVEL